MERLRDLELALAHAQGRATSAETRADHADERRRRSDTARSEAEARRSERASQVDARLHAALERIVDLEFLVDELSRRLAAAEERFPIEPPQQFGPSSSETLAAPNRAERRRSERKKRRGQ